MDQRTDLMGDSANWHLNNVIFIAFLCAISYLSLALPPSAQAASSLLGEVPPLAGEAELGAAIEIGREMPLPEAIDVTSFAHGRHDGDLEAVLELGTHPGEEDANGGECRWRRA